MKKKLLLVYPAMKSRAYDVNSANSSSAKVVRSEGGAGGEFDLTESCFGGKKKSEVLK